MRLHNRYGNKKYGNSAKPVAQLDRLRLDGQAQATLNVPVDYFSTGGGFPLSPAELIIGEDADNAGFSDGSDYGAVRPNHMNNYVLKSFFFDKDGTNSAIQFWIDSKPVLGEGTTITVTFDGYVGDFIYEWVDVDSRYVITNTDSGLNTFIAGELGNTIRYTAKINYVAVIAVNFDSMSKKKLREYITANGGSYTMSETKAELIVIAKAL